MPKPQVDNTTPSLTEIRAAIEHVIADRAALEQKLQGLRLAAAHDRLRGKGDIHELIATRAELIALLDVHDGLEELAVQAQLREIAAAIAEQESIAADVDTRLPELNRQENAAWAAGGYDAMDDPRYTHITGEKLSPAAERRAMLSQQIGEANAARMAARQRIAALHKRETELVDLQTAPV